jgi:uroporphyrinogen decarboxylase
MAPPYLTRPQIWSGRRRGAAASFGELRNGNITIAPACAELKLFSGGASAYRDFLDVDAEFSSCPGCGGIGDNGGFEKGLAMSSKFAPLQNDTFLRALLRQPTEYTPMWLMRQAGRYLPEYCATRKRAGSFLGLAKNPDYATEVTLQPLDRYALDAAILFSDILTVPDAMGLGLYFAEGEGPKFERPLQDEKAVMALKVPELGELQYVFDAVTQIRTELKGSVPLIGFSGSPWTLACYMVEGGGSDDYRKVKTMLYNRPDLMHHILRTNAAAVAAYLNAQIEAGAQAVMIFDSWGGALADGVYQRFSLAYMRDVVSQLKREHDGVKIPAIVFTKGGGLWLEEIADIGADAVGLDWTVNLGKARERVGHKVALQGNLDPNVLFAGPEQIRDEVAKLLDSYGKPEAGHGHVFNLGHGISQFTPPESVSVLVEAVHEMSRALRDGN